MARLLSSLPVGAKVVDKDTKYNGVPITWVVGGHDHYAQGQTVLVSEKIITIKPFDAKEPSNSITNRASYGNNRYAHSNIRQWLNSDKTSWYSPQHSVDSPPTNENVLDNYNEYDVEAGFLTNFSANLRNKLISTPLIVAKNKVTDGGGSEIVTDKVFLLSNTEVGLANENDIAEGKLLAMFSDATSRIAYPTAEALSKSEYKNSTNWVASKPRSYWLRSPYTQATYQSRYVHLDGTRTYNVAYYGINGVRPALNIASSTWVSDSPNSSGEYELILDPPKVSYLKDLPVGAKVVDNGSKYNGVPITWLVGGHDHYAQGQTVLVSEKIITLKSFDAKEPKNTLSDRNLYGNNRYFHSNIRQWLNSDKTSWYSPQHSVDEPPTNSHISESKNEYDLEHGFLTNFGIDLRNVLQTTSLTVVKNDVTDGGNSEVVRDRVFLLSNTEVGLTNENGILEGKILPLFTTANSSRLAFPTAEAVLKSEYKDNALAESKVWDYWLRTPRVDDASYSRYVNNYGTLGHGTAYRGTNGVRPALNLSSVIKVSDNVNNNGEYEIIWPHLTPSNGTDLGDVTDNTSILKYTPTVYPASTTVTEKINGVVVGTKTIVNDTEYTVSATLAQWNAVKYGKYKDTLGNKNVVTLEVSTGEVYTYPFTKALPTTAKTNDVLVAVNDMSNTAMASHKKKLVDAIGNKATVGGTGTLEDIAKAIESISVESLGGAKFAKGLTPVIQSGISGMPTGLSDRKVKVTGLSFTPDLVIVTNESDRGSDRSPIIYRRKLGMLNTYYNLYSAEYQSTTYAAEINEVPNGFELPIRVFGDTTQRWIAFGFEDF